MLLEVKDLSVHYGKAMALEKVQVRVEERGLVAVIGPNGAGKTTFLLAICRLKNSTAGSIIYRNESLLQYGPHEVAKMGISYCPGNKRVFYGMTVEENLLVGGHLLKSSGLKGRMELVHDLFPIIKERRKQAAETLSGGEQQMLAIGMSLMTDPVLLLLDEPTLGLSPLIVEEIGRHIASIKQSGVAILLVEENVDLIRELADIIYVLDSGTSVFWGAFDQLTNNFDLAKTYLGM